MDTVIEDKTLNLNQQEFVVVDKETTEKVREYWDEVASCLEKNNLIEEGDESWKLVNGELNEVVWKETGDGVIDGIDKKGNKWQGHLKMDLEPGTVVTVYTADFSRTSENYPKNQGKVSMYLSKIGDETVQATVNSNLAENGIAQTTKTWEFDKLK